MFDIIITNWHEHEAVIGMSDNNVELLDILDSKDRTGNVYVGRVENIVANLSACFVRFEPGSGKHGIGFLPFKSIPQKHVLNRNIMSSSELRPGDIVLIQVNVEEMKTKQARLTGKIDLHKAGILGDIEELIDIAKTRQEYQQLNGSSSTFSDIKDICDNMKNVTKDTDYRIVTDNTAIYDIIAQDKDSFGGLCELVYYNEEERMLPLTVHYSLTSKTDDLFRKKVWLKSGAFLIIEQTETLNLIDVNSGKNLKKNDEFFLELNKEAAIEAYRQIRLRNLSGMILIDFVSLKNSSLKEKLIGFIKELILDDIQNLTFIDITGLGIAEFTREKRKKTLRETIDIRKN